MSTIHYPDDFEIDFHTDLAWQRQEAALKAITISDVLAEVDGMIASEPAPEKHPLYFLVAYSLDRRVMPGTWEGLWTRYRRLIDHAVEKLIEARLVDSSQWEKD
jgi:hypothetical protein